MYRNSIWIKKPFILHSTLKSLNDKINNNNKNVKKYQNQPIITFETCDRGYKDETGCI